MLYFYIPQAIRFNDMDSFANQNSHRINLPRKCSQIEYRSSILNFGQHRFTELSSETRFIAVNQQFKGRNIIKLQLVIHSLVGEIEQRKECLLFASSQKRIHAFFLAVTIQPLKAVCSSADLQCTFISV